MKTALEINEGDELLILVGNLLWGKKGDVCTFLRRQDSNHDYKKAVILSSENTEFTTECSIEYIIERGDIMPVGSFPKYFITKAGHQVKKHKTQKSGDGTPRYVVNPNSPDNTYSIEGCISSGFKPIYS